MQSYFVKNLFSNETIQVLFWTLMHSLWQGILLAIFAAIILIRTKKSGTQLRYKLLSATLALFIFLSLCTFCYEIYSATNTGSANKFVAIALNKNILIDAQINFPEKLILLLQPYENLIVLAWFIVITFKCIGFLTGLRGIYVLKHTKVFNAGDYWNLRLKELAEKANVKKPVVLLKSLIAEMPMVVGYFKPVILFPAVALTTLAAEEIEAILLHELAHIRRKDYLVNFIQRITEIIFFFNPAVLWISSLIKEERENCCDDIAVNQTKNKKQFVHALVSFQEHAIASKYAPSFAGRNNFLLNRIKRIITNNNKTLNNMEKIFLISGIVITAFIAVAFSQHKQSQFANVIQASTMQNKKDTVPQTVNNNESKYTINTSMDGRQYKLVEVNGKVTELYVNNVRVPDDKISDYNAVINKLQEKLKADKQAQKQAMQAQKKALDAQKELLKANTLAMNEQREKMADDYKMQAEELQAQINNKMKTDSMQVRITEAVKAQAEYLEKKALAMRDEIKDQTAQIKIEALKAQKDYIKQKDVILQKQAEKLAEVMKEKDVIMKEDMEKQVQALKEQAEKQAEMMKEKTELINDKMKKQLEQLNEQNEKLQLQLKQKTDSIFQSKTTEPQGA